MFKRCMDFSIFMNRKPEAFRPLFEFLAKLFEYLYQRSNDATLLRDGRYIVRSVKWRKLELSNSKILDQGGNIVENSVTLWWGTEIFDKLPILSLKQPSISEGII